MDWSNSNIKGVSFRRKNLVKAKFNGANAGLKAFSSLFLIITSFIFSVLSGVIFQLGTAAVISDFNSKPVHTTIIVIFLSVFFSSIVFRSLVVAILLSFTTTIFAVLLAISFGVKSGIISAILEGAIAGIIIIAVISLGIVILAIAGDIAIILMGNWVVSGIVFFVALGIGCTYRIHISHTEAITASIISMISTFIGCYITGQTGFNAKKAIFVRKISVVLSAVGGTSFKDADLTCADFTQTVLKNTDFRNANLTQTYWLNAKGLEFARLGNTYLANPKIRQLVVTCNGQGQNFDGFDLTGVNLKDATLQDSNFAGANFNQSNLRGADLSRAILKQTQLDGTDFRGAILTGAYIEDWGITSTTNLENVQCEYVFMRVPTKENPNPLRKPDNWQETFAAGEFADFIQPYFDTLDLYHSQDVDPRAISIAFKKLSQTYPEAKLEIVAMEKRGQGSFNLKVRTAATADKSELSSEYFADYNQLKALSEARLLLLAEKDDRIHSLEQMIQTALHQPTFTVETVQGDFMPENKGISISAGDNANISGVSSGDGIVNLGTISGNVTNAINQLPDTSETGQASLKTLLAQLQEAIETDTGLPDPDKSDLLEQVQSLAEAKQTEEPTKREGIARKAMKMFDATLKGLPDTAKIVEACSKLLPLILKALGVPA
jgi:uncharacterized protein YjbI with pentapeptide repeats